jgi:hypothetical protein
MDNGEDGSFTMPFCYLNMGVSEDWFAKMKQADVLCDPPGWLSKKGNSRNAVNS